MDRKDTRRRMVETAVQLFRRQGYHATSWRSLVSEAGAPWGSVQHHFPEGKEELGVAAITTSADAMEQQLDALFAQDLSPGEALTRWCNMAADKLEASDFRDGCPVATLALELADTSPALGGACRAAFAQWQAVLERRLTRARMPKARARELAAVVLAGYEGALLLSRANRSTAPLRQVGKHLAVLLAS